MHITQPPKSLLQVDFEMMKLSQAERMRLLIYAIYIQHSWLVIDSPFAGITLISVDRLNLLKVAPGGHVGRFCIWTQSAFSRLDNIYGTWRKGSQEKTGYKYVTCAWIKCFLLSDHLSTWKTLPVLFKNITNLSMHIIGFQLRLLFLVAQIMGLIKKIMSWLCFFCTIPAFLPYELAVFLYNSSLPCESTFFWVWFQPSILTSCSLWVQCGFFYFSWFQPSLWVDFFFSFFWYDCSLLTYKLTVLFFFGMIPAFLSYELTVVFFGTIPAFLHWRWLRQIWPSCWRVRRYKLPWEPPSKFCLILLLSVCFDWACSCSRVVL